MIIQGQYQTNCNGKISLLYFSENSHFTRSCGCLSWACAFCAPIKKRVEAAIIQVCFNTSPYCITINGENVKRKKQVLRNNLKIINRENKNGRSNERINRRINKIAYMRVDDIIILRSKVRNAKQIRKSQLLKMVERKIDDYIRQKQVDGRLNIRVIYHNRYLKDILKEERLKDIQNILAEELKAKAEIKTAYAYLKKIAGSENFNDFNSPVFIVFYGDFRGETPNGGYRGLPLSAGGYRGLPLSADEIENTAAIWDVATPQEKVRIIENCIYEGTGSVTEAGLNYLRKMDYRKYKKAEKAVRIMGKFINRFSESQNMFGIYIE